MIRLVAAILCVASVPMFVYAGDTEIVCSNAGVGLIVGRHAFQAPFVVRCSDNVMSVNGVVVLEQLTGEELRRRLARRLEDDVYTIDDAVAFANNSVLDLRRAGGGYSEDELWARYRALVDEMVDKPRFDDYVIEYDNISRYGRITSKSAGGGSCGVFQMLSVEIPQGYASLTHFIGPLGAALDSGGGVIVFAPGSVEILDMCGVGDVFRGHARYINEVGDGDGGGVGGGAHAGVSVECLTVEGVKLIDQACSVWQ